MAEKVKVKAVKITLPAEGGSDPGYRFEVMPEAHIQEEQFWRDLGAKMGVGANIAQSWADSYGRVFVDHIMKNNSVSTGYLHAKLNVKGTAKTASDQPDKKKNPVTATVSFTGRVFSAVKELEAKNVTLTVEASILGVAQAGLVEQNLVTQANTAVDVTGHGLKLDTSNPDEFVAIFKDGALVQACSVTDSNANTLQFTVPVLPEDGEYQLRISTRNGENKDEYATTVLTRNITIAHAA